LPSHIRTLRLGLFQEDWVTSGAGTWGPRVRTSGRPEVLLIDLSPSLPEVIMSD
jgi:predicted MPP superfamily phosphohydrolase